jgi:hypothetical protein
VLGQVVSDDELGAANCVFAKVNVVDEDSTKAGIAKVVAAFGAAAVVGDEVDAALLDGR